MAVIFYNIIIYQMIEWEDKFSVGISIIDEEHKKLIGILNKAIFAKEHNNNPKEIEEVLNELVNYASTHFATEEAYMVKFNYPEYKYHKEEHNNFSIKTNAYLDQVIGGDYHIANEILEHLKWWLTNHIQGTDKKYVDCFKRNGLK